MICFKFLEYHKIKFWDIYWRNRTAWNIGRANNSYFKFTSEKQQNETHKTQQNLVF